MPPKPKFTREQIIAVGLDLVRERGLEGLTAREVGARLGASARPIFTVFENMEELTREVCTAAAKRIDAYAERASIYNPMFAREEPKLFQLILMRENKNVTTSDALFENLGPAAKEAIASMQAQYALNPDAARMLFEQIWIFTYGVSALCATGMCRFTDEELSEMITREFSGILSQIRRENPSGGNENAAHH